MPANPSVFASHSHLDNAFGLRLIADLRAKLGDAAVWYDVSGGLHGGDEWRREIVKQITTRDVFMVILSPNALASAYVQWEMDMAYHLYLTQHKRLLPIHYQPCALEIDWEIIHWLPCRDPQQDEVGYAQDVIAILADLLQTPAGDKTLLRTPPSVAIPTPMPSSSTTPMRVAAPQVVAPPLIASPPTPAASMLPSDHLPAQLVSLGFVGKTYNGVEAITPPLCDVPAGSFPMGSSKQRDKQAANDELPQKDMFVRAFQIARHPVTVAEYACYVHATGQQPSGWQDQASKLDHPVVNVSWHEAMAYARWLAQTTGQLWRLPTEAEWEKAARSTDGRIYPWGDEWDNTRANTRDGGPGRTTPMGSYPSGVSPYGAQDMTGNVWEWCSSLVRRYPYDPATCEDPNNTTDERVLRGGSWNSLPQHSRAASRDGFRPDLWVNLLGFRLARQ
ncbi:MAG TPA: SUMF1/EgtB/PvdO family nonheme iron enzyme [Ktedonobacterales bacterium]|nr:SUMF1/EgtB/PvdO family nonheme iron enzyme [Ktedonobacterales bacterium]